MTNSGRRRNATLTAAAILVLGPLGVAHAQVPDRFTNLQVFAKDISRKDLVGAMRSWAGALGIRC